LRDELTGGWAEFYNEEFHNFYFMSEFIRMMKSRRMRWAGHVAWKGAKINEYEVLLGKLEGTARKT
jgi:hypothetical protein